MQTLVFEKPRSRKRVEISSVDEDDWFLNVTRLEKKSGKISSKVMIIQKDLEIWIVYLLGSGWIQKS